MSQEGPIIGGSKEGGVGDSGVDRQTQAVSSGGQRENSPKSHQRLGCEQREKGAGRGLGRASATNVLGVKAEELSSTSQHPWLKKKMGVVMHASIVSTGVAETGGFLPLSGRPA